MKTTVDSSMLNSEIRLAVILFCSSLADSKVVHDK